MKRTHLRVLLAGMLALSLAACSSLGWKGFSNPFAPSSTATAPATPSPDAAKAPANGADPSAQK